MLEKFISGAVIAAIVVGTPKLYKLGKQKKAEAIRNGKVYYGLLWCRILALVFAGFLSADMLLLMLFGDAVEGLAALLILLVVTVPFAILYIWLYKRRFKKKYLTASKE